GGAFDVFSIDMADVFLNGSGNLVTFTGIHSDLSVTVNVIGLTNGSTLDTYALTGMTDLIALEILDADLVGNALQIDNLTTVPEPATLAVLALGVAALALRRRR
ncbi:MAG: PEP-CTERM sorting domain-containing protein, partial [Fimbriimonadales bacterium]